MLGTPTNRIQEFRQSGILKGLEGMYGKSKEEELQKAYIRGGICYMLSTEWLLKLLDAGAAPDGIYIYPATEDKDKVYYKQIANNFCKYIADFHYSHGGGEKLPSAERLDFSTTAFNGDYISQCSAGRHGIALGGGTLDTDNTDMTGIVGAGGTPGFLLLLRVPNHGGVSGFGHALALWCAGGNYFLFDPNYGVYQYNSLTGMGDMIFNVYVSWHYPGMPVTDRPRLEVVSLT